jgi:hypothetical protein
MGKGQNLVVNQSGRECQGLPDVFVLEFRIFAFEFGAIGVSCQSLKNAADCKTEISNARFAIHPRGVDRDSVKFLHAEFSQSGLEQQTASLLPGGCATNRDFPEHTRSGRRKHQWTKGRTSTQARLGTGGGFQFAPSASREGFLVPVLSFPLLLLLLLRFLIIVR